MPWTETLGAIMTGAGCVTQATAPTGNGDWSAPARSDAHACTMSREIWNAVQYVAAPGYQWRLLPRDFPPFTIPLLPLARLRLLALVNEALVAASGLVEGREAELTAPSEEELSYTEPR